jgi:hypothetical protein
MKRSSFAEITSPPPGTTTSPAASIANAFSVASCPIPNGDLTDGYNYYQVNQVYPTFFQNPRACLGSIGPLVKRDPQFLLYMLSYSFGFSKNMMVFIRQNNESVFQATLKIATLYFQIVGSKNATPPVEFKPTDQELAIITDGTLKSVLQYRVEYVSDLITLSMYYDLYRRFQGIIEDCLIEKYKPSGIVSTGKTKDVNKSIQDIISAIMGNATLNLGTSDLGKKFSAISEYSKKMHDTFNGLLNIFKTNLKNNVKTINSNLTNKQFMESVATDQLTIDFANFKVKLASDVYPNAYEAFKDTISNANIESTYLYFCMLSVLYSHATGNMFMDILKDIDENVSLYFNFDGTFKTGNNMTIQQVMNNIFEVYTL